MEQASNASTPLQNVGHIQIEGPLKQVPSATRSETRKSIVRENNKDLPRASSTPNRTGPQLINFFSQVPPSLSRAANPTPQSPTPPHGHNT